MRSLASILLSAVALAQLLLLGGSAGFLVFKLQSIQTEVARLGQEEELLMERLAGVERDLYQLSILLRDNLLSTGLEQDAAIRELSELLARAQTAPLRLNASPNAELQKRLDLIESARQDYLNRARLILSWTAKERQTSAHQYLLSELAPTRKRFSEAVSALPGVLKSLRQARLKTAADSLAAIERLTLQVLTWAALLGLAITVAALWKFQQFGRERDLQFRRLQDAEESLRALSQRLVDSQEQERKHLSRELHDEVGQVLTALRVQLGQAAELSAPNPHLGKAAELAERSLQTVRQMARGLRPAMLDDLGLGPALKWLARDVSNHAGLDVELELEGEFLGLDEPRRTCIYRVAQEALTNCAKHAQGSKVRVVLHESPWDLVLTVQDNGQGATIGKSQGLGLLGMRERVEEFGGEFSIVSAPGAGMLVRANLPKEGMRSR